MSESSLEKELQQRIQELETDVRHLQNELRLTRGEYEDSSRKYFEVYFQLEEKVNERTRELEQKNIELKSEIEERRQAERERGRLEGKLRQSMKLEAIGTLAGGIAHDFNNILVGILGFAELAKDDLPADSPVRSDLDQVIEAGKRARDLIRHILTFSRQGDQEIAPIQIHPLIKEAVKLLRPTLPANIEIRQKIETEAAIMGDPTEIHQILMNLCTNARYAMEETGGVIEISLGETTLKSVDLKTIPDVEAGQFVELTVSDTGVGIDEEIIGNIFDPYFTTRKSGKGTGMGLAVVHGIVNSYGGTITVESVRGRGTAFHIFFPKTDLDVLPDIVADEMVPTGTEHILFVDDVWGVVNFGKKMLERLGYTVTSRTSSVEALEAFRAQPEKFDLVITDQTMPNMIGTELAREILSVRPDLPIILCTGYSAYITEEQVKAMGIREYVMKPFVRREMAEVIRRVLDAGT